MRKLKFRYFCKDRSGCVFTFIKTIEEMERAELNINTYERIQEIISRCIYTGLKDKNDVEIYKGDILRIFDKNYEVKVIETGSKTFIDYGYPDEHNGPCNYWSKVIGNHYQNPELLDVNE